MTLITSISGIRGTIGGAPGTGLTPVDIVKFSAGYAVFLKNTITNKRLRVVVGRDARISGPMVNSLVTGTLLGMGIDVIDIGLSTTPTVEIAVQHSGADGGIIITASHNPKQWNALKLLNSQGEFLSEHDGSEVLLLAEKQKYHYAGINELGRLTVSDEYFDIHINKILSLPLVDVEAIRKAGFRVAVDCVNSTGGIVIPMLLSALGVKEIEKIYCDPTGDFPHNPEPLSENLTEISDLVVKKHCHVGFAVDPDVDRLAIIEEDGTMFGEEYTLVAVADYVLKSEAGNTVSNLSSTRALADITEKAGGNYAASAVGEVNVVEMMKKTNAVIGGEGNGGVIYPDCHYGRDALVGIALFLSHLARSGKKCSALKHQYPEYHISKNKLELMPGMNIESILEQIADKYSQNPINTIDGVRIEFGKEWVHLRKSNTEPIIRIYSESDSPAKADHLAKKITDDIREIIKTQI